MSQHLAEGFACYRAALYRNLPELPADQARDIQYAFNSGVLWILNEFLILQESDPAKMAEYSGSIIREVVEWYRAVHPGLKAKLEELGR